MAHYLHALQAGGSFWGDVVQAEFQNILDGNGIQRTNAKGELIALVGGWATFIEQRMMNELYGSAFIPTNIKSFTLYTRPNSRNEFEN